MPETPGAPYVLLQADARRLPLADASVHCAITSPPYFALRDYGTAVWEGGDPACAHAVRENPRVETSGLQGGKATTGHQREGFRRRCPRCGARRVDRQIGLEGQHDCTGWATGRTCGACYVCTLRTVAREVWRVLRPDGTFWLNLGDSFNAAGRTGQGTRIGCKQGTNRAAMAGQDQCRPTAAGLKPKDLIGIPWRVAFALQADGWILRAGIPWVKPSAMPEPVKDRPSFTHEYIFLLVKQQRYFYDADAVRIAPKPESLERYEYSLHSVYGNAKAYGGTQSHSMSRAKRMGDFMHPGGRNRRTTDWLFEGLLTGEDGEPLAFTVNAGAFPGAHFATFPPALVEPMILAGTSERGCCPACGVPWVRVVERGEPDIQQRRACGGDSTGGYSGKGTKDYRGARVKDPSAVKARILAGMVHRRTAGWQPTCACAAGDPVPCTVLDPFAGAGTTLVVARRLGRTGIGCDINAEYLAMAEHRIANYHRRDPAPAGGTRNGQPSLFEEGTEWNS